MTAMAQHPHRVSTGVGQMRAIATDLADASMWSMGGEEAAATIQELTRLEAQVAELKLRTLTRIDQADLAGDTGATSTATGTRSPSGTTPFSQGGETNRNALMLCPNHHARAHDQRSTITKLPDRKIGFHRRT